MMFNTGLFTCLQAAKLLELFDLLPGTELMNGLDVLQGVVNTAVHKITSGRYVGIDIYYTMSLFLINTLFLFCPLYKKSFTPHTLYFYKSLGMFL